MRKLFNRKTTIILSGFIVALVLVMTSYVISNNFASKKAAAGTSEFTNGVILQGFEWFLEDYGLQEEKGADVETLWEFYSNNASALADAGITAIWLPPAFKTDNLTEGMTQGYEPYDLYDLGEFNQKGRTATKYGTKDQYLAAIDALHENDIQAYADIIIGHKTGADAEEYDVSVNQMDWNNRGNVVSSYNINSWTKFEFSGRNGKYSSFKWNKNHFDAYTLNGNLYMFSGKSWDTVLSTEYGVDDYLMFLDYDLDNQEVANELKSWGKWYVDFCDLDGFRIDAVKHMDYEFVKDFIDSVESSTGKDLYAVGEYFDTNVDELNTYIGKTNGEVGLFDFPLKYNMMTASRSGSTYDLTKLYTGTLVESSPVSAVTFIDNHDEQNGRYAMDGKTLKNEHVLKSFKPQAYTAILTREEGYPCVFYGDYYGTSYEEDIQEELNELLYVRRNFAYGEQENYFFDSNCIGWTRCGDDEHENSGLAALISDYAGYSKYEKAMYVGIDNAGEIWMDYSGNSSGYVTIDSNGYGNFTCNGASYSVWAKADEATLAKIQSIKEQNKVVVYFASSWENNYIHYRVDSGAWTSGNGVLMESAGNTAYDVYTVDLGSGSKLEFCFNNGSGTWNNNSNKNFIYGTGIYTINGTTVTEGIPAGVSLPDSATDDSDSSSEGDSEDVVATATPEQSTTQTSSNIARVYYYTGWSNPYAHYKVEGEDWTASPGVAMKETASGDYFYYDIDLGNGAYADVCLNNGGSQWDSNNNSNYRVYKGDNTIVNGSISTSAPRNLSIDVTASNYNKVTIYFDNTSYWSNVYVHYQLDSGAWTSLPGAKMTHATGNYYTYTIDLGSASSTTFCFTDGNGNWMSNNSTNYNLTEGIYTISGTSISTVIPQ